VYVPVRLQGIRPANHPRLRLRQYAALNRGRPEWPALWKTVAPAFLHAESRQKTALMRKRLKIHSLRESWREDILGGAMAGTRLENLFCDGLLPLLATQNPVDLHELWFHWFIGDVPAVWRIALRELDVFAGREQPACHGWTQGLLGWLIERERSALVSAGHRA